MRRLTLLCSAAFTLTCTSLAAQDRVKGIADTLAALPTLAPLTSAACLEGVTLPRTQFQLETVQASILGAPYEHPFDLDAAQITADVVADALATNANTQAFADELPGVTALAFLDLHGFIESAGFDADNVVDVAAFYLVALSSLDQNNVTFVEDLGTIMPLRDQIALGEANCGQIAAALEETPELTSYLVAHMAILFETFEEVAGTPDLAPIQATARELFGAQLAGRSLTPRNGLQ